MATKKNLTDRTLKGLKPSDKHFDTWDRNVRGLGVLTSPAGRKTFVLMTRYPGSQNPTRRALGTYGELTLEQARTKARDWLQLISQGKDPAVAEEEKRQAELRRQSNTFASVLDDYLRLHVVGRQRKGDEVARDLRRVFVKLWGARPVTEITRYDVLNLIEGIRDHGTVITLGEKGKSKPAPVQARNLLGCLKTFFSWAIERGTYGLESSPCDHLRSARIIGERQSSERTLTDAELVAFWQATGHWGYPHGPLYRLLLLSGLRLNEVADAQWSEFDLAKKIWTISAARMKGKSGKARPHSVPLTADMLALLEGLPRFAGDYLFSLNSGASPVWVTSEVKKRLDARMTDLMGKEITPWVNHDLRRTVRSRLSELRVSADVAEAVLAHVKPGIRGVYDRYELFDEKRHALELWATRLRSITEPQPNVVELARARP
jgi:integrase